MEGKEGKGVTYKCPYIPRACLSVCICLSLPLSLFICSLSASLLFARLVFMAHNVNMCRVDTINGFHNLDAFSEPINHIFNSCLLARNLCFILLSPLSLIFSEFSICMIMKSNTILMFFCSLYIMYIYICNNSLVYI